MPTLLLFAARYLLIVSLPTYTSWIGILQHLVISLHQASSSTEMAIATGLWWNYSGSVGRALILTLPVGYGNLLVSALAILVKMAGTSFWNITALLLHCWNVQDGPASAVVLQHRVILRNSRSALSMVWESLKIHHAWSASKPSRLLWHTCSISIPALVIWTGFTAAALFSSAVANKAYGAVIARTKAEACGFWEYNTSNAAGYAAKTSKLNNDAVQARMYAANFYNRNVTSSSTARSIFVRPSLPYSTSTSAPCPVPASRRCLLGRNAAYSVTTDLLDSHEMLGINASPQDRVSLQFDLTCSPLFTDDLVQPKVYRNATHLVWFLGNTATNGRVISNNTYTYNLEAARAVDGYLIS